MSILANERQEARTSGALDFEALVSPISPGEFFDRYWAKSILVLHRQDPEYYGDLFTLEDVDRCLHLAAPSQATVLELVAPPGSGRQTRTLQVTAISKDRIYDAYLTGDTVRLIGVEKFWPPIALLIADLQEALNATVGANLFLTPAHSQGFAMHFDLVDVMVLQLAGAKQWFIWEPTYEKPTETKLVRQSLKDLTVKDESKLTLREEILLKPGDFFYMPRGYYHKALAVDELSLHLTFSIHPLYWMDFLHRAFEIAALEEPELRGELPPGFANNPKVQQVMSKTFATIMQKFKEKASFDATLRSMSEEWIGARHFPVDGHFAALSSLSELNQDTLVERRHGLIPVLETSGVSVAIKFGPNRVQGPAALVPALEFVRDNRRFRIADLPGALSAESKVVLIRRLIREGLLKPVSHNVTS